MSNILARVKAKVLEVEAPPVAQVFEKPEELEESVIVQSFVEPKVIKQNNPGTPLVGFTLETLADELGVVLEKAMHKAGVSSVNADVFGVFHTAGVIPKGFILVTDEYINQDFFVLKNSNRMTEIFKSLVKALNSSSSEVISFPYLVETNLELPLSYSAVKSDFESKAIKTTGLYLTPKEIENLNYKFITEIQFCGKSDEVEGSIDLLAMKIDREEWKSAPYRT